MFALIHFLHDLHASSNSRTLPMDALRQMRASPSVQPLPGFLAPTGAALTPIHPVRNSSIIGRSSLPALLYLQTIHIAMLLPSPFTTDGTLGTTAVLELAKSNRTHPLIGLTVLVCSWLSLSAVRSESYPGACCNSVSAMRCVLKPGETPWPPRGCWGYFGGTVPWRQPPRQRYAGTLALI